MKTKNVTVQGQSYQLRKLDPVTGSFIYLRMMGVFMLAAQNEETKRQYDTPDDAPKPSEEERARILITGSIMRGLSLEDSRMASQAALRCISQRTMIKENEVYIPIMSDDGRWSDPQLADSPKTVHLLIIESLVYSLQPFFENSGSSAA